MYTKLEDTEWNYTFHSSVVRQRYGTGILKTVTQPHIASHTHPHPHTPNQKIRLTYFCLYMYAEERKKETFFPVTFMYVFIYVWMWRGLECILIRLFLQISSFRLAYSLSLLDFLLVKVSFFFFFFFPLVFFPYNISLSH